jgi:hypothetical protein
MYHVYSITFALAILTFGEACDVYSGGLLDATGGEGGGDADSPCDPECARPLDAGLCLMRCAPGSDACCVVDGGS